MTAIRVLLADDQDLVRGGFRMILESEPGITVVGEARDGAEAVELAEALSPDVVCMDVQMPVMDGLEATRRIRRRGGRASVLVVTTFDRDDYLFDALQSGASGFLLKNASPEKLVEAVLTVASGDALLAPDVTRRVIERYVTLPTAARGAVVGTGPGEAMPGGRGAADALTEREREVLALLARGRSNAEIAVELFVGEATVKTHVSKVLQKLGLRDRIEAVVFAYESGIAVPRTAG